MKALSKTELGQMIDHTLLKPEATRHMIENLCNEAMEWGFATVCVNPCYVSTCYDLLRNSKVGICTVIGFPLGASDTEVKVFETTRAIADGATEVDMVINIGALKSGNDEFVLSEISEIVTAAKRIPVKVILETALLTSEEIVKACQLSLKAKATFVKTSTGFSTRGASLEDMTLMKSVVGNQMKIKASGGIRDFASAIKFIEAGATRLGTSAGALIMKGLPVADNSY